jgi:uncharacterized membrane protein YgcG
MTVKDGRSSGRCGSRLAVARTVPLPIVLSVVLAALAFTVLAAIPAAASPMPQAGTVAAVTGCGPADACGGEWGPVPGGETGQQSDPSEKSWEFERFDSDITVHDDGSFTVRETQVINFTGSFSFITRDIPVRTASFDEGRTYGKVRVKDVKVLNLDGTPYDSGLWSVDSYEGGVTVRIEFQARDEQRGWIISYRMKGAVIYAEGYDRLYWNAVSQRRPVPIRSSRITVTLPPETPMDEVRFTDYFIPPPDGSSDSGREGDIIWWEAENIGPNVPFTIDVAVPKGIIDKPLPYRYTTLLLVLAIVFATLLCTGGLMLFRWWRKGRDAYGGPQLSVTYEPPHDLRPAVMGMLVYQRPRLDDLSATVVDLAVRGKLKIIEEAGAETYGAKKFSFERRDAYAGDLLPYEREVMEGMFAKGELVGEDDLELSGRISAILRGVMEETKKRQLFHGEPQKTIGRYFRRGMALIFFPLPLLILLSFWTELGYFWLLLAGTVPSGLLVCILAHAMPRRTEEGSRLFRQAMGFKEYLETAEAGEPESMTIQSFQENLPYAMVFGRARKWAVLFTGILTVSPEWYSGTQPAFDAAAMASSLAGMQTSLYSLGSSSSSDSGSGFDFSSGGGGFGGGSSGGGFGGGGSSAG